MGRRIDTDAFNTRRVPRLRRRPRPRRALGSEIFRFSEAERDLIANAANLTVVKLSDAGTLSIYGLDGPSDVVADVFGWYYAPLAEPV